MSELADLIRDELAVGDDSYYASPENMRKVIAAVLDIHTPYAVYDECGHEHQLTAELQVPDGLRIVDEIGVVCDEGFQYLACRDCCTDDGGQTEECATNHNHLVRAGCPTVQAIAEQLDLLAEVDHDSTG